MSTIVLRSVKGSPLSNAEVDSNFTNLNTDKLEAATTATLTNKTINLTSNTLVATSAQLAAAVTDETGTGALVFANSPTFVTPALGTPASGVVTNLTGTASININGTVGATTANTGAFTTLSASGNVTLDGGTANGVSFLNASKVLTTGSALTFDGTALAPDGTGRTLGTSSLRWGTVFATAFADGADQLLGSSGAQVRIGYGSSWTSQAFAIGGAEQMRLTSTGLGIGTSSPAMRLSLLSSTLNAASVGTSNLMAFRQQLDAGAQDNAVVFFNTSGGANNIAYGFAIGNDFTNDGIGNFKIQNKFTAGSSTSEVGTIDGRQLAFNILGTERLRIDSAGNTLQTGGTNVSWVGVNAETLGGLSVKYSGQATTSSGPSLAFINDDNIFSTRTPYTSGAIKSIHTSASNGERQADLAFYAHSGGASQSGSLQERLRITSGGNVGIGTSAPDSKLAVLANANTELPFIAQNINNNVDTDPAVTQTVVRLRRSAKPGVTFFSVADFGISRYEVSGANARTQMDIRLSHGSTSTPEATVMSLRSNGNVGIGTSAPAQALEISRGAGVAAATLYRGNNNASGSSFFVGQGTAGNALLFQEANTEMRFGTNNTERARITSGGDLLVGKTSVDISVAGCELLASGQVNFTANDSVPLDINRLATDGALIRFFQATTEEGSISVSGTTVSYNGGHLSRWAQMLTKPDLLKGTVLSNLDEMNVYTDAEGNPVENEQLNKVKVSDVEGDANVAGVFVNWTHDDAHNVDEINMAMTGDMIIRIAQGTTIQRGDLLMSAGDGTAKPQGDDIVRSKTIAKVTSTHVTCTYADGSFCVPCVLMAC